MRELLRRGDVSRTELADRLGLSTMAVGRIVRELVDAGLVREAGTIDKAEGPGRRQTSLELIPTGLYGAGIVASAYYQQVAIVDSLGQVVAERSVPVEDVGNGAATLKELCRALVDLIESAGVPPRRIAGIGGSLAAVVDPAAGAVVSAGYLGWEPFSLKRAVAAITDLPSAFENISKANNRAEAFMGVAQDASSVALIHAATTLGMSFSLNGALLRGNELQAGRIGHLPYAETKRFCSCGRNNCLNCSGSGWSILSELGIVEGAKYRPDLVAHYAAEIERLVCADGNEDGEASQAKSAFIRAGVALASALWQINLIDDPEMIVLTGSLSRSRSYLAGIFEGLSETENDSRSTASKIVIGQLGAARAAAIVALDEFAYSPRLRLAHLDAPAEQAAQP